MISYKKIDVTDILLVLFIFGSVVFDSGDNLMKLIKILFIIPCYVYVLKLRKIYFDTYVKWMLCFAVFAGLSFIWAISITNAVYRYQTIILNLICIFCLMVYIKNRTDRIELILKTLLWAPIILEIRVALSYGLLVFADKRGVEGVVSPNAIGMYAGIAVVLGAFFFMRENKYKNIYFLSMTVNTLIVILSASRKAILFILIPLLLFYILRQKNSLKILGSVMVSIGLIAVTYYAIMNISFVYDMVGYRIETMISGLMGTGKTDGSTSLRLKMIKWGLEWFEARPLTGYGINNYMNLLGTMNTSYGTAGVYAHNNYVELLVDLGLIGTMIYYFIYLKMLLKAVRIRNVLTPIQTLLVSILVSIIICEYGMVTYFQIYVQIILALTWLLLFPEKEMAKGAACVIET